MNFGFFQTAAPENPDILSCLPFMDPFLLPEQQLSIGGLQKHGMYAADFGTLGFKTLPGVKYTYDIISADSVSFTAQATAIEDVDGDGGGEVWTIDQTDSLVHKMAD